MFNRVFVSAPTTLSKLLNYEIILRDRAYT